MSLLDEVNKAVTPRKFGYKTWALAGIKVPQEDGRVAGSLRKM